MNTPQEKTPPEGDTLRKSLATAPRRRTRRRAQHPLHRPAPRPRGHQPAGLRRPPHDRPQASPPRPHGRDGGPQRPHEQHRRPPPHRRSDRFEADRGAAQELRRLRRRTLRRAVAESRHRPHHRPRTRPHEARHDHRLRRLAHQHPRGVWRVGFRNRDKRGRARHGHADPAAGQAKDLPHQRRRHAPNRRHRQGHRPPHHRPDRHRRSHRPRHRIRRLRHPQPLDGRPHDHLQHEHRGRSPRRHDRPRRHHLRLPQRPPLLAARSSMGRGCQALVRTCNRRRSNLRPRTDHRRHRHHSNRKLGHLARHGHRRQKHRSPARSPSL